MIPQAVFLLNPMNPPRFSRLITAVGTALLVWTLTALRPVSVHANHTGKTAAPQLLTTTLITNLLPFFVDPLPIPQVAKPARTTNGYCVSVLLDECYTNALEVYDMPMLSIQQSFHSNLPPMEVWGYAGQYPGPTIEAKVGVPLLVNWINNLTNNEGMYPYWLQADTNLFHGGHRSDLGAQSIRTVVHLHGAAVLPRYDGYPTNWFLPNDSDEYFYGNIDFNSDGQTLWYHDHAVGVTGNNVYAGLAGFYLVRAEGYDANHQIRLPSGPHEIPLVFQDRDFAVYELLESGVTNCVTNLYTGPLPWHYQAVVNGKVTPFLEVEPRPYRFRILNGAGFRAFTLGMAVTTADGSAYPTNLTVPAAPKFLVVGNEDGYLQYASSTPRIAMMPGERVDVVVDFSAFTNAPYTNITVQNAFGINNGNNGNVPSAPFITNLMQFRVSLPLTTNGTQDIHIPSPLVANWVTTSNMVSLAVTNRGLTLDLSVESPFPGPPFVSTNHNYPFALINMMRFEEPVNDFPHAGDVEVWEIINLSNEAHPLHIHLLDFRVVNRQRFASDTNTLTTPWNGDLSTPPVMVTNYINDRRAQTLKPLVNYLSLNPADLQGAQAFESGPKDVVRAAPFAVTRIVMQWPTNSMFYSTPSARSGDPATDGRYIFHCHILDHEDSDMMRPLQVKPPWQFTHSAFSTGTFDPDGIPQFSLAYPYRPNQKYRIEAATDLRMPNWRVISASGAALDISNARYLLTLPAKDALQFYRVAPVLPQP